MEFLIETSTLPPEMPENQISKLRIDSFKCNFVPIIMSIEWVTRKTLCWVCLLVMLLQKLVFKSLNISLELDCLRN